MPPANNLGIAPQAKLVIVRALNGKGAAATRTSSRA